MSCACAAAYGGKRPLRFELGYPVIGYPVTVIGYREPQTILPTTSYPTIPRPAVLGRTSPASRFASWTLSPLTARLGTMSLVSLFANVVTSAGRDTNPCGQYIPPDASEPPHEQPCTTRASRPHTSTATLKSFVAPSAINFSRAVARPRLSSLHNTAQHIVER